MKPAEWDNIDKTNHYEMHKLDAKIHHVEFMNKKQKLAAGS
jgi:hypothetical protein